MRVRACATGCEGVLPPGRLPTARSRPRRPLALDVCSGRRCRDALVAHGVAREQLMISFEGMGGHVRVDFIPEVRERSPHQQQHLLLLPRTLLREMALEDRSNPMRARYEGLICEPYV